MKRGEAKLAEIEFTIERGKENRQKQNFQEGVVNKCENPNINHFCLVTFVSVTYLFTLFVFIVENTSPLMHTKAVA